ncbi:SDR family NAD(P)-dependent oxidoreductase [Bradyrhizobium neotropicale]|uniref:SDR family NAD(P)-dependent oxidoreductase n=1 Tax=Bradyrhizobium neotropicale TaxID=1497615 RepID=UPI001AD77D6A|nr:SDR family NAD(P)-dependent oxidoreductase [Bradyrhizobium neotropicale]MBO4226818.1 SDR family NAD(P)-dependent oxidoreductase [Bradyrhizobium neotropicale]
MDRKVTLITGVSRGIGRQIAVECARAGHPVFVNFVKSRDTAEDLVAVISREGGQAIAVQGDVSIEVDAARIVAATLDRFGCIDCLINNAGVGDRISLEDLTSETFDRVLQLNLTSAFMVSQAAIPRMMEKGGRLIFMSSGAARTGGIISAAYAASKARNGRADGLLGDISAETSHHCECHAPSLISTDMIDRATAHSADGLPLGRFGRPDEIWPAVRIMETKYLTGQTIHIDAGRYMT